MEDKLKIICDILESLEQYRQINFSWRFVNPSLSRFIPTQYVYHHCRFCLRTKGTPCWRLDKCIEEHQRKGFLRALEERQPFIVHCHAGAVELAVPVFVDNALVAVLYAGVFRDARGATYSILNAEYAKLPLADEKELYKLGELLSKIIRAVMGESDVQEKAPPLLPDIQELLPDIQASDERLYQAWTYMGERCKEKLTADKVAAQVKMSTSRFLHLFSEQMPYSFHNTLIRIRLIQAQRMIEGSTLSFGHIAENTGFADQSRMTVLFKRYLGKTPSQLRQSRNVYL